MTKAELERLKLEKEVKLLDEKLRYAKIKTGQEKIDYRRKCHTNLEARVLNFITDVDKTAVRNSIDLLQQWSREAPKCDITVVFNSPGGSVMDGFALYDEILGLKTRGHNVTTIARGMVASMGGVLLQAGSERVIGENTQMMIHEVSLFSVGKTSELGDDHEFAKALQMRCFDILAERSTLTSKQIQKKADRRDWWLDADEALKLGFADSFG